MRFRTRRFIPVEGIIPRRLRRGSFIESNTELLRWIFFRLVLRTAQPSVTTPIGYTHFICTVVPLSKVFGLLCLSHGLLILPSSQCSALPSGHLPTHHQQKLLQIMLFTQYLAVLNEKLDATALRPASHHFVLTYYGTLMQEV
jgi:hypothetical protein